MLSISSRSAATSDIRAYLEGERDGANRGPEDYYAESGRTRGHWLGSGAAELGLTGEITEQSFDRLAAGFHPNTAAALVQRAGEHHRPGWDLTFSAPKSVSVVWGIAERGERAAIERVHNEAVKRTLGFASEQHLFITRRGKDGIERESVRPIIATYVHGTSREADPQLHTHAFVMNVAARNDGSFGTLESKPLFEWKMALGAVYRAELAEGLREIGYETAADSKGSFRLKAVPRDAERHFSKRRILIERAMAERGARGAKAAELAALATRQEKETTSATTLRAKWRAEALALGLTAERVAELSAERRLEHRAIDTAAVIEHASAARSTFTRGDIVRAVAESAQVAGGGLERIKETTQTVEADKRVVRLNAERLSTRAMLELERGALERAKRLSAAPAYRVSPEAKAAAVKNRPLSEEQRAALDHLFDESRLANLEGLAGTGKSHLLGTAREAWDASGYETRAAVLAGKAAKGLSEATGLRVQTLHSLLVDEIHVELTDAQAWELAQFLKRACFRDYRDHATSDEEAYQMIDASEFVRRALAEQGYAPR